MILIENKHQEIIINRNKMIDITQYIQTMLLYFNNKYIMHKNKASILRVNNDGSRYN